MLLSKLAWVPAHSQNDKNGKDQDGNWAHRDADADIDGDDAGDDEDNSDWTLW